MKNRNTIETEAPTPQWVDMLLHNYHQMEQLPETEASEAFLARCRTAGERGAALARMREERAQIGRLRIPLREYIEGIAARAGVLLAPFFEAYGITQPPPPDATCASGLARLARMIGIGEDEVVAGIRYSFDPSWTERVAVLARDAGHHAAAPQDTPARGAHPAAEAAVAAAQAVYREPEI